APPWGGRQPVLSCRGRSARCGGRGAPGALRRQRASRARPAGSARGSGRPRPRGCGRMSSTGLESWREPTAEPVPEGVLVIADLAPKAYTTLVGQVPAEAFLVNTVERMEVTDQTNAAVSQTRPGAPTRRSAGSPGTPRPAPPAGGPDG